jgi:chlorobactene glucosyltransferase
VLVAAKDEQENIGRCVEGLLAQDYPRLQVIVTNDRSSDRTGEIIDSHAARDQRLTAVHVEELRDGWFGKNNAMRAGMERATGDWLCFSDADCAYDSPRLLTAAVRFALREQVDFLSVLPRLEVGTFWERVVQPVAGAIMVFWFPPQKVNSPQSKRAYANGAFMLMPRRTYDAIGGHEPVKATLNEDMHMARRVKAAGLRLQVIRGGALYHVRMYTGIKQIWRGWSRIFYGCFGTFPRLLVSVLMLSVFSLSPYVTLLASPLVGTGWSWLTAAAGFAVVAQQSILWRFYHVTGNPRWWALSYPLGAALCLGMTLNAMRRLGGQTTTTWRGTTYRGGARTAPESSHPGQSPDSLSR